MKKIFTKRLFIYMLAALLVTIISIFALQTFISKSNRSLTSQDKLEEVQEKLKILVKITLQKRGPLPTCLQQMLLLMVIQTG